MSYDFGLPGHPCESVGIASLFEFANRLFSFSGWIFWICLVALRSGLRGHPEVETLAWAFSHKSLHVLLIVQKLPFWRIAANPLSPPIYLFVYRYQSIRIMFGRMTRFRLQAAVRGWKARLDVHPAGPKEQRSNESGTGSCKDGTLTPRPWSKVHTGYNIYIYIIIAILFFFVQSSTSGLWSHWSNSNIPWVRSQPMPFKISREQQQASYCNNTTSGCLGEDVICVFIHPTAEGFLWVVWELFLVCVGMSVKEKSRTLNEGEQIAISIQAWWYKG